MSARTKLNAIHLGWIVLFSTFAALLLQSWIAGLIVAVVLAGIAIHGGKLRLAPEVVARRPLPSPLKRPLYSRRNR